MFLVIAPTGRSYGTEQPTSRPVARGAEVFLQNQGLLGASPRRSVVQLCRAAERRSCGAGSLFLWNAIGSREMAWTDESEKAARDEACQLKMKVMSARQQVRATSASSANPQETKNEKKTYVFFFPLCVF